MHLPIPTPLCWDTFTSYTMSAFSQDKVKHSFQSQTSYFFFWTCGNYVCGIYIHTAILRKVVGKNVHATIAKGNMGYDQYMVPDTVSDEPTFVDFLYHLQTYVLSFFQISLKNSELKTTHNTLWGCCMYFIWQPSSKQLYFSSRGHCKMMLIL